MAKRRGQWVGDRVIQAVQMVPDVSEVIQILPPATALESIRDIVFERAIIGFGVRRLTSGTIDDLSWVAWHGRVGDNTLIPLEALNPRSASQTTMAHSSIVQFGILPVPPVTNRFDSAGAAVGASLDLGILTEMVDFDVKRSIQRGNEGIFLTLASTLDSVVNVTVQWRCYYTYA